MNAIPMILHCPSCVERHIDAGKFVRKEHHTHACQYCGFVWRPAIVSTVGVQFLPGFKDELSPPLPPTPSPISSDVVIALKPWEKGEIYRTLKNEQGLSSRSIGQKLGVSPSHVSALIKILEKGDPRILRLWKAGDKHASTSVLNRYIVMDSWDHDQQWRAWQERRWPEATQSTQSRMTEDAHIRATLKLTCQCYSDECWPECLYAESRESLDDA